jgi:hypothetical protein
MASTHKSHPLPRVAQVMLMVKTVKARLADIGALIREIHPADTIPGVPQVHPLTRKLQ